MATASPKRKKAIPSSGARVYSYIRFSTPEQAEGDSERRQIEKAENWAKQHGHTFDASLQADRGRSGYSGAHRKKGNLGKFLARVEAGEVPRGSILVVEELRRLTREGIYAGFKETIGKLWDAGIAIQTLAPEYTYTRETVENDLATGVTLTLLLQLAREESRQKSEWGQSTWKHKREDARNEGRVLTSMAPEWFERETYHADGGIERRRLVKDEAGKPIPIPEAVAAIKQMFLWKDKGWGDGSITRALNRSKMWTPPRKKRKGGKKGELTEKGWNDSYVHKILTNRAVIGEYQPHRKVNGKRIPDGEPIEDYFPAIIDRKLFFRTRRRAEKNRTQANGGRNDKSNNLFQKLVFCAYCGGAMHYVDKGSTWQYLGCANAKAAKTCEYHTIRYDECEEAILKNCARLDFEQVLPSKKEDAQLCRKLQKQIASSQGILADIDGKIRNLMEQIERTKDAKLRDHYESRVIELREERDAEQAELRKAMADLEAAEQGVATYVDWQKNLKGLKQAMESAKDDDKVELRQRLNAHLREIIDRIEVFPIGHKQEADDRNGIETPGDNFRDWLAVVEDEAYPNGRKKTKAERTNQERFIQWALQQRMTKKGRFLRIHFSGPRPYTVDVVPEGSIAGLVDIGLLQSKWGRNRSI